MGAWARAERGKGFVAVNNGDGDGTTVADDRTATITVPAHGAVAPHTQAASRGQRSGARRSS
ncbi:hypothetical protein, partial [Streptomyces griseus]|uniref:hypothetical protein n=1 Tax=Streptomyces griseus TaxID=1911 RepID=UPI003681791C